MGPLYPEYLPTSNHKPQLIQQIIGELSWAPLIQGVLSRLVLQDEPVHSLLVLPAESCWQHVRVCLSMVQEEPKLVFLNSDISEDHETVDQGIIV